MSKEQIHAQNFREVFSGYEHGYLILAFLVFCSILIHNISANLSVGMYVCQCPFGCKEVLRLLN